MNFYHRKQTLIDDRTALHLDGEPHADDAQDPQPLFVETAAEALLVPDISDENISFKLEKYIQSCHVSFLA